MTLPFRTRGVDLRLTKPAHLLLSPARQRRPACHGAIQVYDQFVARVTELTKKLRQGPVLGKETVDCGAMVMPAQLDIVQVLDQSSVRRDLILRGTTEPVPDDCG